MSVRLIDGVVEFFCILVESGVVVVSVVERGVLKSPAVFMDLSVSPFTSLFCFPYLVALLLSAYIQDVFLVDRNFYHYVPSLSVSGNLLCCEVYFI